MRFDPTKDTTARTKKALLKKRAKRRHDKWASPDTCNVRYFLNKKNTK